MHCFLCNDAERRVGGISLGGSAWRAGRFFVHSSGRSRAMVWWHFFSRLNWAEVSVKFDTEEGGEIALGVIVPWLASFGISLPLPTRWLRPWMIQDRVFDLRLGYIGDIAWIEVAWAQWAQDCGMTDYYRRERPRKYTDLQLWPGWQLKLRWPPLLDWVFGKRKYRQETRRSMPIQILMDMHQHDGLWTLRETWSERQRWPWRYHVRFYSDIDMPDPPQFAGKGENSWDCGNDGICGMSSRELTPLGAIGDYMAAVMKARAKYGMPSGRL